VIDTLHLFLVCVVMFSAGWTLASLSICDIWCKLLSPQVLREQGAQFIKAAEKKEKALEEQGK
jgi:hypothetical protein